MLSRPLISVMAACAGLVCGAHSQVTGAEDLPLGVVTSVTDDAVRVSIEAVDLEADDMLAIYGPGTVEKHPLTGQVTLERRRRIATAQVLHVGDGIRARVVWQADDAVLAAGLDVVPLPDEASPDAPPVLSVPQLPQFSVPAQGRVRITLPVIDPEGGELRTAWSVPAEAGQAGVLGAASTAEPSVVWSAPARPGEVVLQVEVTDAAGQALSLDVPVTVADLPQNFRQRDYTLQAVRGGRSEPIQWIGRGPHGRWWQIIAGDVVWSDPGWRQVRPLAVQEGVRLDNVVAVVPGDGQIAVLDRRAVHLLAEDGVLRASFSAGLGQPTDMVQLRDGSFAIADQRAGGVMVIESDGRVRARLGYAGDGPDAFQGLARIAAGADGTIYALDATSLKIVRFDRHHKRLADWQIAGADGDDKAPIDLSVHRDGLLVVLADGSILAFDAEGSATRAWPSARDISWLEDLREPSSITADLDGHVLVTWPAAGLVVRYTADGKLAGVRGPELWSADAIAADGRGRVIALDKDAKRLAIFDADGWLLEQFGGDVDDGGHFERPGQIAVSPNGQHLAVVDTGRVAVVRYDLDRLADRPLIIGQRGENNGQFEEPTAISIDESGRIYVLDEDLHRVVVFDANGRFQMNVGRYDRGREADELDEPKFIAASPDGSSLYVYDADTYAVKRFALDHTGNSFRHIANGGGRGDEPGQLSRPLGLGVDRFGLLYVADSSREDLQVLDFRESNMVPVVAVDLDAVGLSRIKGVTIDADGRGWVLDSTRVFGFGW